MNTEIFSVFPACGKTWMCEHQEELDLKILDSDSSLFSWIYANGVKERNPDFPNNYIKHLKENIGKYDYIFVSSHASVRAALDKEGIAFTIVYPHMCYKAEWVGRCFIREKNGENGCSAEVMYNNWEQWVSECVATSYDHDAIVLHAGRHLSEYI
jgi:hypothetical protein